MSRPLPSSFDSNPDFYEESRFRKLMRRVREEPFVPLGMIVTCIALYKATQSIKKGDKAMTNKMFRARIYGQGFTLAAMLAGTLYYKEQRAQEKEVEVVKAQEKREERKQAWLKELEARDEEDKEIALQAAKLAERRKLAEGASIGEQAKAAAQTRNAVLEEKKEKEKEKEKQ
ncbi:hypothetical protein EX30DRAFT_360781 [Ascodesmis nigricans]|uniref:HIG1 domain-containing protein n=1 Tax=Ascodesmis nigricans TaxID=341454 RepID=A0A4S2N6J8_9PEZI|nr:hypothetical protein EX30DRAFT_360781 [Ascodesmis nigricans]